MRKFWGKGLAKGRGGRLVAPVPGFAGVWLMALIVVLLAGGCVTTPTEDSVAVGGTVTTNDQALADMAGSGDQQRLGGSEDGLPTNVAVLPFVNRTDKEEAFEIVRRTIFSHFSSRNYRTLHWRETDQRLAAADLSDPEAVAETSPEELGRLLGVDGLLLGEITHYDRVFAGVYGQVAVGVRLRLILTDGTEVWSGEDVVRKHGGGLPTTPIGIIMAAASAAMQLREVELFRAADDLGRTLIAKIPQPERLAGRERPVITQVVHDGVGRILQYGDTFKVALEGTPGQQAFANIPGSGLGLIDLTESTETPGQYAGEIAISPEMNVDEGSVVGVLRDQFGGQSEWISPLGLVTIDNQPTDPVGDLMATGRDGGLTLSWAPPAQSDLESYRVEAADVIQGPYELLGEVREPRFDIEGLANFARRHYRVTAVDRVKQESEPAMVEAAALPDPRFAEAQPLTSALPVAIEGLTRMSPDQGPFVLTGRTTLAEGAVLLIEPGVQIQVGPNGVLVVRGELRAYGTSEAPIRVSGSDPAGFKAFLELESAAPVMVRGLTIEKGGIPVVVAAGQPQIIDCRILESRYSAIEIRGTSRPLVQGTEIRGGSAGAVIVMGRAQPRFVGNRFVGNRIHLQSFSPYEIDARDNAWNPAPSARTILGNVNH